VTSNPHFKVTTFFDIECQKRREIQPSLLLNVNRKTHGLYRRVLFRMTLSDTEPAFQGHGILISRICQKRRVLTTKLLKNTNTKPYTIYRMTTLSMTISDVWRLFQPHYILWSRVLQKRLDLKTNILLHNRKLHVTYGMVLYLVTLTILQNRRAHLSASAQLLVTCATP